MHIDLFRTVKSHTLILLVFAPLWALLLHVGCDNTPEATTEAKVADKKAQSGVVQLTAEEIQSGGIEVQPVRRSDFHTSRDFPGTVVPNSHAVADITALVRGRVADVYADLGQEVKAGQLLAMLDSGELGMAQSSYLKANAKLYVAERAFKRAQSLLEEKVIGVAEAQRREGDLISIRAETREARDRLRLFGMNDQDIHRLDRDQTIHSFVPIAAPFDGRVIARNLTKGEVVETTEKLFVVADLSEVWVLANIPEKDIPYFYQDRSMEGKSTEVRVSAYPTEIFHGVITYVGDVLNPATRTMQLRLELQNRERKLKPEMFATVRVYSEPEHNVLVVPDASVQRERERLFVFVQTGPRTFEVRHVKLGDSNGTVVKILEGLQEGQPVVVKGAFILKSELLGDQI